MENVEQKWKHMISSKNSEHSEATKVPTPKTFEQKRGFKGSMQVVSKKIQVQCGCIDSWTKQMRKKHTSPVSVRAIVFRHELCKVCGCVPWLVLPKKDAYHLLTSSLNQKCACTDAHRKHGAKCLACETKGGKS